MLKVLYAGCPDAAAVTLKCLIENASSSHSGGTVYEICGVLTNPPSAKGRKKDLVPTPVALVAEENGIPVFTPEKLNGECRQQIEMLHADILVCFAYGHIFGPKFLAMFKYGGINLHPSLLPKYRGCTPVNAAILNMDSETAFTIQTLAEGMDEGDILAQTVVQLDGSETAGSLLNDAAVCGAGHIIEVLSEIEKCGTLPAGRVQSGEPSYTKIIKKEDGLIDWNLSCRRIEAMIRAYTPEPGCYTYIGGESGETLRIIEAAYMDYENLFAGNQPAEIATPKEKYDSEQNGTVIEFNKRLGILIKCSDGVLCVKQLQKQNKKVMPYKDFMNGVRNFIGSHLG